MCLCWSPLTAGLRYVEWTFRFASLSNYETMKTCVFERRTARCKKPQFELNDTSTTADSNALIVDIGMLFMCACIYCSFFLISPVMTVCHWLASSPMYIKVLLLGNIIYTECPRRKGQNFGRVFRMLNYTDITQNTYIQSWTVTEIMVREKCGLLAGPRTVPVSWQSLSMFVLECGVRLQKFGSH
jgi:hypothetical protein